MSLKRPHIHKEKLITIRQLLILFLFGAVWTGHAADQIFESGPQRVHLIELFTSQGCSSCPPTEAWLSELKTKPELWRNFVPLAFHVDYWDHLGWHDPFASKEWSARQKQYFATWGNDSVYTPCLVLDGTSELLERTVPGPPEKKPGVLKLSIANGKVVAEYAPTDRGTRDVDLHVAALAFDLKTKPTAGENSGRDLRQDFVVLSLTKQKMLGGKAEFTFNPDLRAGAIAAWITSS
ncbi:MAG: DUF1223 domain-containing protein, partial [Verrucomicrobia bacterium]|nr:DUF1223 domain-containing protein [Verrucomicrobiota bacterium]